MNKFSVVIPIYNGEKYIDRCLNSVLNQSIPCNIICINDGSADNSLNILKDYSKKYDFIKVINQKNKGLSVARNKGISEVVTEYFLLLDCDDFLDNRALEILDKTTINSPDIVRFQAREVNSNSKVLRNYYENGFYELNGHDAFSHIVHYHYVETACLYLYNTKYFKSNHFKYKVGVYHEDFGLTPLVIIKAGCVNSISNIIYNYVQNSDSIMHTSDYSKVRKKAYDALELYRENINLDDDKVYKSFLANSVILKLKGLNSNDFRDYKDKLNELDVCDNLLDNTLCRRIKRFIIRRILH